MFWGKMTEISRVVREIPIREIAAPEFLPKRTGEGDSRALEALAESIRVHGVIEPLLVRRLPAGERRESQKSGEDGMGAEAEKTGEARECAEKRMPEEGGAAYSLIAGERRLRAARMAGKASVPCILTEGSDADAAALAIVENLHREDLNLFEAAAAIDSLIRLTGMTQEQCAGRLGVSQSYVANKLRLLRLTEDERRLIVENGLTERHGRALLRFPTPEERAPVLAAMIGREMNVAAAEEYAESLLCADARADELRRAKGREDVRRRLISRDTRRFTDSIERAVDVIRRAGIPVEAERRATADGTLISILLPKSS